MRFNTRTAFRASGWMLASLVSSLAMYTVFIEPARLIVRQVNIPARETASPTSEIKVAVVSDLHVGSPFNGLGRIDAIVDKVSRENPDLILLLGDFLISGVKGGTFVGPEPIARKLARLSAPLGVYTVLGNHDWWEDGVGMTRALETHGITVLENQAVPLEWHGSQFWLVGLSDDTTRNPDVRLAYSLVPQDATSIVMTHDPGAYLDFPDAFRPALLLGGHTHGGQIYLPWLFDPLIPGRAGPEWARGLIDFNGTPLYVTSGIGTSILPVRLNCPPEIVIITVSTDR